METEKAHAKFVASDHDIISLRAVCTDLYHSLARRKVLLNVQNFMSHDSQRACRHRPHGALITKFCVTDSPPFALALSAEDLTGSMSPDLYYPEEGGSVV